MSHKTKNKTLTKLCGHKNKPNLKILLLTVSHYSIVMMIKFYKLELWAKLAKLISVSYGLKFVLL